MAEPEFHPDMPFQVGDILILQGDDTPVTIETLTSTPFGDSFSCCWFGSDDALHFGKIATHRIDHRVAKSEELDLRVGTEVRLGSNGPVMTILDFETDKDRLYALCEWTGPFNRNRTRKFPVDCLTLTLQDWTAIRSPNSTNCKTR